MGKIKERKGLIKFLTEVTDESESRQKLNNVVLGKFHFLHFSSCGPKDTGLANTFFSG